jgi:hypothetical protein
MNIDSIANIYTEKIIESMFKESVLFPNYQRFIETVKEYKGLTRWHWKRKRTLEPIIASLSIKIVDAMVKYQKEHPQVIKFQTKDEPIRE